MTTLTRLSFWLPAEQVTRFEAAYRKRLIPILEKHDLVESSPPTTSSVAGVFSRLFEVESPADISTNEQALLADRAWDEGLRSVATSLDLPATGITCRLRLFSTTAPSFEATPAGTGFRHGLWRSFNRLDGMSVADTCAVLQDHIGHLWFAGKWLCRYDGSRFYTLDATGLSSHSVLAMAEDHEGRKWFGTGNWKYGSAPAEGSGVLCLDGGTWRLFTTEDGLPSEAVRSVAVDRDGSVWLGTDGGVSHYDGSRFRNFTEADGLVSNSVNVVYPDSSGVLWFGTQDGVSRYDGREFTTLRKTDGLVDDCVIAIARDRDEGMWFATLSGVSRYHNGDFTSFTAETGLVHDHVTAIEVDGDGRVWLGTLGGVSRYDGDSFTTFTIHEGLVHNVVGSILEDRQGHIWVGTVGGGVSRYDGGRFTHFTAKEGLVDEGVMALTQDRRGDLWLGTWSGVNRYDGSSLTSVKELQGEYVYDLLEDRRGWLWFGTRNGVKCFDGDTWQTFTTEDGLAHNSVLCLGEDSAGNVWCGSGFDPGRGVSCYDGSTWKVFTVEDGLGDDSVRAILEDRQGFLWFGTDGGGVSRYDGRQFTTFTSEDGLEANSVACILEDRHGRLWFGLGGGGVCWYDGERFVPLAAEAGMKGYTVLSVMEDDRGHLWFATFGWGVRHFDGLVCQSLSRKNGLPHDTVQDILQDRNGDMWFATEGGATRYSPRHSPPEVRITAVIADRQYGEVGEVTVPASQKALVFEFQGSSLTTGQDEMAYVFRLLGLESDWQVAPLPRVEIQDLQLGEYTFEVRSVDVDLNYSEPVAVVVKVIPDPRLEALTDALNRDGGSAEFVGNSVALQQVQDQLVEVAPTDLTVLVLGETGTGKGLAARALHRASGRKSGPFIHVNCGAIPESLVESELFGHEKGAFTGAVSRQLGKVELAAGGTLFLDEIGDMSLSSQVKLLRFLEEHEFERVGGRETLKADVRIVAATNRDLQAMTVDGGFREDLYFRLQSFLIRLPPLRERVDDIPLLARYFAEHFARHLSRPIPDISPDAEERLRFYEWPGNVRELEHLMQRAVLLCHDDVIQSRDVAVGTRHEPQPTGSDGLLTLAEQEKRHIQQTLEKTNGKIYGERGAARLLDIHPDTLRSRMKKLGIRK